MESMKRWVFPIEPAELVQILRDHSSEKEGPFSWTAKGADDRPILFLDAPKKSGKGGFRCLVKAVRYLTPSSPLAKGAEHILTLRISRARGSNAAVMLKCHKTEQYGAACLHFAEEMDKLLSELTTTVLQVEPGLSGPVGSGILRQGLQAASTVNGSVLRADAVEPSDADPAPRVGHPGLDHEELIYRLAKAQEAEETRQEDKGMTWKEIAREIRWNKGSSKAAIKLLADARQRLHRLAPDDPLLVEVAAWRRTQEKQET